MGFTLGLIAILLNGGVTLRGWVAWNQGLGTEFKKGFYMLHPCALGCLGVEAWVRQ